jgi:hypothetical protein
MQEKILHLTVKRKLELKTRKSHSENLPHYSGGAPGHSGDRSGHALQNTARRSIELIRGFPTLNHSKNAFEFQTINVFESRRREFLSGFFPSHRTASFAPASQSSS